MGRAALGYFGIFLSILIIIITLGINSYSSTLITPEIYETTPTGTIDLELRAPKSYLIPLQEHTLTLHIKADSQATGVDVTLNYDPAIIEVLSVTKGDFFPNTLESPHIEDGQITFTYAAAPDSGGTQESGVVAFINVKPLTSGPFSITFDPSTLATGIDPESGEPIDGNTIRLLVTPALVARMTTDLNADGEVNLADYNMFLPDYGYQQDPIAGPADFNESGEVDLADYNQFVATYGQTI